jgi:S1-C subfamily serine protease
VTTRGHARLRHASLHAAERLLQQAFAAATDNLAGDAAFRTLLLDAGVPPRLLGGPAAGTAAAVPGETITLPAVPAFRGALAAHAEDVRAAVVLLEGGIGHGSGFLVSPDGHVLTNAHVVGEADRIRVRLLDGRVRAGSVLRRDRVRDVALVHIPGDGYPVLPIRSAPVTVGETVHAIGAPLQPDLYGTLTRGVVSALRRAEWDGQDYIQADVTIQGGNSGGPLVDAEGNVVGIAVSGISPSPDRLSAGLNFFIPIAEALDRLGLGRAGPDGRDARG